MMFFLYCLVCGVFCWFTLVGFLGDFFIVFYLTETQPTCVSACISVNSSIYLLEQ